MLKLIDQLQIRMKNDKIHFIFVHSSLVSMKLKLNKTNLYRKVWKWMGKPIIWNTILFYMTCPSPSNTQVSAWWYSDSHGEIVSAIIDKRFVNKISDKTAILRKYDMSTKILFCRHNNVLFLKRKHTFKKLNRIK